MRDCCSHQQNTFGEIFAVLLENYLSVWVLFAVSVFVFTIFKFFYQTEKTDNDKIKAD